MIGIGIKVSVPFLNNQTGSSKLKDLKSHMLGWYDVKRQGCTNDSLAENPVLEDLGGEKYTFDFGEYKNGKSNIVDSKTIKGTVYTFYKDLTKDIESFNIQINGLVSGYIRFYYRPNSGKEKFIDYDSDGVYSVPKCFNVVAGTGFYTGFVFENTNSNVIITMLPTKAKHPLELKNFTFGGLSGMGGYGTDLTKWINYKLTIPVNKYSVDVPTSVVNSTPVNFRLSASNLTYFRAKCSIDGAWYVYVMHTHFRKEICRASSGEPVEVYFNSKDFDSVPQGNLVIYFDSRFTGYTLEILPNFPNSLVFNGVTPEYVINKDNVTLSKFTTAIGLNKFKVMRYDYRAISYYITGKAGEPLTVSVPSFMVRVTELEGKDSIVFIYYMDSTGNYVYVNIRSDGTYIVPAINCTLDAKEDGSAIKKEAIRISVDHISHDVTLEILPNYPPTTTKMYGIIPTITQRAKCMMMDFVPTFPINNSDGYISYYTQRQQQSGKQYALMTNKDGLITIAYNNFNSNGTYINGQLNNKLKHVNLLNKRQVVSVNAKEVYEMPANRGIVIAADETLISCFPTMALNSLILFDRELTEEEMKLVMDKLMKYEDTDNIAGDLSRSARETALDESNEYNEGQEITETPVEFNDSTV